MPPTEDTKDKFLGPFFEAAENGERRAARTLTKIALGQIESGKALPPKLRAFFLGLVTHPTLYAEIMEFKPKKRRGRPSIDDDLITADVVGLQHMMRFGARASETNALAVHHLILQGQTLNADGSRDKASAVDAISELTGRSARSLQGDYAKHKTTILAMEPDAAERSAQSAFLRLESLSELRRLYAKEPPSQ